MKPALQVCQGVVISKRQGWPNLEQEGVVSGLKVTKSQHTCIACAADLYFTFCIKVLKYRVQHMKHQGLQEQPVVPESTRNVVVQLRMLYDVG